MDPFDDDFGELYADVEVQVKSTFNNAPECSKLYREPETEEDNNNNNKNANLKSNARTEENLVSESTQKAPSIEGDDGSDSEDELKIVLNDDERFTVNCGSVGYDENKDGSDQIGSKRSELNANCHGYNSQYNFMRSHGAPFSSNSRVNGSAKGAKGDWEDNGFNQQKGPNLWQYANIWAGCMANSVVPQWAYGFSLPWHRSILDVNIDTYQEKPWSHRGANVSDFFNFGFNENSWKRYCKLLEQYQDRSMQARYPAYEPSKLIQTHEVGSKCAKADQVPRSDNVIHVGSSSKYLNKPRGRVIEVEGNTDERQPSVEFRRPCFRDSDVVIQINVQDSAEEFSGSGQEKVGHMDSNNGDHETSNSGNLELDHRRDVHNCTTTSEDEFSADSVGRDARKLCTSSAARRCSQSLGSDDHANGKISDGDEYHLQKVNVCTSEGTPEAVKSVNKADELIGGKKTCKSDSYLIETELSLGVHCQFSTSPSTSGSDSELSKDGVHGDPVKICTLLRRSSPNSGTEFKDFVTSDHKNSLTNGFKTTQRNRKYYLRNRSSHQEDQNQGRHHGVVEWKSYLESDYDASPMKGRKGDGKYYLRPSPVKEKWKHCHGVICSSSEQKIFPANGDNISKMSDAECLSDRDYRFIDCRGNNKRLYYFDYPHPEDLSYHRETGLSSIYGKERFGDKDVQAVHKKHPCGRYHPSFGDQRDPYAGKRRDEKEYYHERSFRAANEDDMDGGWYYNKRGISSEYMIPFASGESRQLAPKCSPTFKERGTKWRSKNEKIRFGNKINHDGVFPDYKQEDEYVLEKYGRSVSFSDRKNERDFAFVGREVAIPVRRGRYGNSSIFHFNKSWPIGVESVYRKRKNQQSSISQSSRGFYTATRRRLHDTISSMDDVCGQRRRHICDEGLRDNDWFGMYKDNHLGRRHGWRSRELPRIEDELTARGKDNEFFSEKASSLYEETSLDEKIHAKYESNYDGILIDDRQLEHHRYELMTEGNNNKCVNRNSIMFRRGEHEHTIMRCRDSIDSIIGEGKSSGGQSNGRSLMCNYRFEKIDMKFCNRQTTSMDFLKSERGKAVRTNIQKIEGNKNTEKWLDKYQATEHNEDLVVEEGQIIMEEQDMDNHLEEKHVSESKVTTCNVKKRISCGENASIENNDVQNYDKQYILVTLAKMEKRRERFKDPITLKKEQGKNANPQADLMVDTAETKQQRPARKRRWDGS